MSATCENCRRPTEQYLCQSCQGVLRATLVSLTGAPDPWLGALRETAVGHVRYGPAQRRTPGPSTTLNGDAPLAEQIDLLPEHDASEDDNLRLARHQRARNVLKKAVSHGRVNLRASELLDYTHSVLSEWVRDLCETRGIPAPQLTTTEAHARWLATHVSAIACTPGASVCYTEITQIQTDIERAVDRPHSPRYWGPCPTPEADNGQTCATGLFALTPDADAVTCWRCHQTHQIHDLIERALASIDELLYSARDILEILRQTGQPLSERVWRDWRAKGRLTIRGWRGAEPMYWISDVRDLMRARPNTATRPSQK